MSNEELIITNELEEQTLQETQENKQNKDRKTKENSLEDVHRKKLLEFTRTT